VNSFAAPVVNIQEEPARDQPARPNVNRGCLMLRQPENRSPVPMLQITPKDRETLQLLADGKELTGLANHFGVGETDVEADLTALFAALGAANRFEAVDIARKRGLLDAPPV
jgi:DNA-binding NarL/FixJ family response regulator